MTEHAQLCQTVMYLTSRGQMIQPYSQWPCKHLDMEAKPLSALLYDNVGIVLFDHHHHHHHRHGRD
jgi:hypothetical protein